MCEINPKHESYFRLEAFTSHDMTRKEFDKAVTEKLLYIEMKLNEDARFRFHIHPEDIDP